MATGETGVRASLIHALRRFIYRDNIAIVPGSLHYIWPERQFLRRTLNELHIDCVLDVGANVGQFAEELRLIGYKGLILSFEPVPHCHATLSAKAAKDDKWHTFQSALGSTPGTAELNVTEATELSSFLTPAGAAGTAFFATPAAVVEKISVPVGTLNEMLPDLQKRFGFRKCFLKMDTQGFDVEVFRGAGLVRDRILGLQSEVSVQPIYEGLPTWYEAIEEYTAADFKLTGLFPVNPGTEIIEFNCYMVNNR